MYSCIEASEKYVILDIADFSLNYLDFILLEALYLTTGASMFYSALMQQSVRRNSFPFFKKVWLIGMIHQSFQHYTSHWSQWNLKVRYWTFTGSFPIMCVRVCDIQSHVSKLPLTQQGCRGKKVALALISILQLNGQSLRPFWIFAIGIKYSLSF